MKRLLIISHDGVGRSMAGPGIRYWELARALAPHLAVTLVAPRPIDLAEAGVATASYAWGDPASLAAYLAHADVVLANGYLLQAHPELAQLRVPLLLDLYDPTLLENLELHRGDPPAERAAQAEHDIALLNRQLAAGDGFLCATERQRDLYIGALMAAGRVTAARAEADPLLRGLIDVVPFGLPAEPPAKSGPALRGVLPTIGEHDPIVLWSGGLWDWMDPQGLVLAMPAVVALVPNVRLVFLAGKHPSLGLLPRAAQQARALAAELGLLESNIFFYEEWVPYAQRADFLLEADVVVSLHREHLETIYSAVRSRILDYFWVGLPSVLSDDDPAAALIRSSGAGLVTPIGDYKAVAAALVRLLTDPGLRAEQSRQARALAVRFHWPQLIGPILTFVATEPQQLATDIKLPSQSVVRLPTSTTMTHAESPINAALIERDRLISATRNAALTAQEQTWRIVERPVQGGRLARLRRLLIDQFVRPFVRPLIDQQQEQNAAVLRTAYALAEQADLRQQQFEQRQQQFEQRQQQLRDGLALLTVQANDMEERLLHRIGNIEEGMQQMNHRAVSQVHQAGQQIRDFAAQIEGLEQTSDQLLRRLSGGPTAPPQAHQEVD